MMNPIQVISEQFAFRLCISLAHFLWQGIAIFLLVLACESLISKRLTRVRYWLQVGGLMMMATCLPLNYSLTMSRTSSVNLVDSQAGEFPLDSPKTNSTISSTVESTQVSDEETEAPGTVSADPALAKKGNTRKLLSESIPQPWVLTLTRIVTVLYLAGVCALLLRMAGGIRGGILLRSASSPVTDTALLEQLERLIQRFGMSVRPSLAWCDRVSTPVVVGVVKPAILLPLSAATGLLPDHLEAMLAHELAHIARHDLIVNLLQRVIESLLFFHPAVWALSRRITREREQACDEFVVSAGWDRVRYADALLRMAEISAPKQGLHIPASGLAATSGSPSEFKRRLLAILGHDASPHLRPSRAVAFSLLAFLMFGLVLVNFHAWATVNKGKSHPLDEPIVAFADGISVELVAVRDLQSPSDWWAPSGRMLETQPFGPPQFAVASPVMQAGLRDFIYRVKGLDRSQEVRLFLKDNPGHSLWTIPHSANLVDGELVSNLIIPLPARITQTDVVIDVTSAKWLTPIKVSPALLVTNLGELDLETKRLAELVHLLAVSEELGIPPATTDPDKLARKYGRQASLKLRWDNSLTADFAHLELKVVDKSGSTLQLHAWGPQQRIKRQTVHSARFACPLEDVDHFEVCLHPVQHRVRFSGGNENRGTDADR